MVAVVVPAVAAADSSRRELQSLPLLLLLHQLLLLA
jgi:hypothetical protein